MLSLPMQNKGFLNGALQLLLYQFCRILTCTVLVALLGVLGGHKNSLYSKS